MRVVMLEAPESLLEERRKAGLDKRDELWEGVLHVVPPPSSWHQDVSLELIVFLRPIAMARGLKACFETGLYATERDYRVPDLMFTRPERVTVRGVDGPAELVIEVLSPGDESRDKLPFYERLGVQEVLLLDPNTRSLELYLLRDRRLLAAAPADDGALRSVALGVSFTTNQGPRLHLRGPDGQQLEV